jgi:hypothetical protein
MSQVVGCRLLLDGVARGRGCGGVLRQRHDPGAIYQYVDPRSLVKDPSCGISDGGWGAQVDGTKNGEIDELSAFIFSNTGVILLSVRPRRMMVEGEVDARERAVSAPWLLRLPPVMTTVLKTYDQKGVREIYLQEKENQVVFTT